MENKVLVEIYFPAVEIVRDVFLYGHSINVIIYIPIHAVL